MIPCQPRSDDFDAERERGREREEEIRGVFTRGVERGVRVGMDGIERARVSKLKMDRLRKTRRWNRLGERQSIWDKLVSENLPV